MIRGIGQEFIRLKPTLKRLLPIRGDVGIRHSTCLARQSALPHQSPAQAFLTICLISFLDFTTPV